MEQVLQRWSWVLSLLATVVAAFLVARIANTFVGTAVSPNPSIDLSLGSVPLASTSPHEDLSLQRFARSFGIPIPSLKDEAEASGAGGAEPGPSAGWEEIPVRSSLRGLLVSTAIANPERFSLCQITNQDSNETSVFAIGERFLGATIYKVEKERVLIENNGKNEYIDNSAAAAPSLGVSPIPAVPGAGGEGVKVVSENQYVVAKREIDNALTNLSDLATKARIVPSFKNGVANGFKLFSIVPDSLYSKIGVQNGDVIRKINGYEMNSPDKALEIYQKLRDATRIEIELERRGENIRKTYSIE